MEQRCCNQMEQMEFLVLSDIYDVSNGRWSNYGVRCLI